MSLWPFSSKKAKLKKEEGVARQSKQPAMPVRRRKSTSPSRSPPRRKLSKKTSVRRRAPARLDTSVKTRDFGVAPLAPIAPSSPMDVSGFDRQPESVDSREDITALPGRVEIGSKHAPPPPNHAPPPPPPTLQRMQDGFGERRDSVEDITALPFSKELRTSPHLRPATQDTADIPYDWNLQTASHYSLPVARERGKLQRNPSRNKRAAYDSPLAKRKPSKKRKDEHLREEEIRAMSAPMNIPRQVSGTDSGLLRRDSRKMRAGLNRNFERPMSNISLPLEDSIHSAMSTPSDSRNYRLSVRDIVAPRPTIRYTVTNPYSIYSQQPARGESRATTASARRLPTGQNTDKAERARIDSLADDLDSTELRELMERDKRRKEKKRKNDIEKVHRKLQKRVDRQQAKELREFEKREGKAPVTEVTSSDRGRSKRERTGLGIATVPKKELEPATATAVEAEPATVIAPESENDATAGAAPEATSPMEDVQETSSATPVIHKPASNNSLGRDEIPRMPLLGSHGDEDDDGRTLETPFEEREDEDLEETQSATSYSHGDVLPRSPLYPGDRSKASKVLGEDVAMGSFSKVSKLLGENVPRPLSSATPPPEARRDSDREKQEKKRSGMWSAIFRRDRRKSSIERGQSPSEASFSNTSRESMSRHIPPTHLYQTVSNTRSLSGAPIRTQSKFKEDLPELPLSPPDSRVQSPEATTAETAALANRRGIAPATIQTDLAAGGRLSSPYENLTSRGRTDSPASGGRQSNLMSQSLASVDSEASWLSGKPHRMSSTARKHNSTGTASVSRAADEFSASYEELGIPDDEYFRRLNVPQGENIASGLSAPKRVSHKASSSAMAGGSGKSDSEDGRRSSPPRPKVDGETVVHNGASRHPTVVHRDPRVRSVEGLLNQYNDSEDDIKAADAYITPRDSPTKASHDEGDVSSEDMTPLAHATSVKLGKQHARNLSAGSARLLEITKRSASSTPTMPTTPTFSTVVPKEPST